MPFRSNAPTARLAFFVAASLALHSATLGVRLTSGHSRAAVESPAVPALQATLVRSIDDSALAPLPAIPDDPPAKGIDSQTEAKRADVTAQGTAANEVLNLPIADRWYPASELDVRAEPLEAVDFEYPPAAARHLSGHIEVALYIDERGYVRKAKVLRSEPEHVFDDAVLKVWRGVRFAPAMRSGTAVKSEKIVQVDFQP